MSTRSRASARTLGFVDSIEEGRARLLLRDAHGAWRGFDLPQAVLPQGAREGQWIELSAKSAAPPPEADAAAALRARLGRSDRGGDFSL